MKKIRVFFLLFLLGMACQVNASDDKMEISNRYICESLIKAAYSQDPLVLSNCVSEMKRIIKYCPDNWLASYYACLYQLRYILSNPNGDFTNPLDYVDQTLTHLKIMKGADHSEVYTLEGLYQLVYLAKYPDRFCKTTYDNLMDLFDKAISLNSSNPRPRILKFIVQYRMGKSLGYDMLNEAQQSDNIQSLLKNERMNLPYPSWGKELWNILFNKPV